MQGRRSTPERIGRGIVQPTLKSAVPGDLSFVLPYRYLTGIVSAAEILKRGGFSAGFGTSREEKYPVDSEMNSFAC